MADVQFNENELNRSSVRYTEGGLKGISGLIIKTGFAKNEKSANLVMIVIMLVSFSVAGYLLAKSFGLFGAGEEAPIYPPDGFGRPIVE